MRRPGYLGAIALALPVAVFAAYWPALRGTLVWDDDAHVTAAGLRSLAGLRRIWAEPGATQQYYPVLHSAFWVEHRAWGDSLVGYHAVNVLLHLVATLLLYLVLRRLSVPGAAFAASAFALHPVCVESVAWISEQKNTLSAVFYLGAALAYLRFDRDRRPRWYALGLGLFALAVLSKSVTATLPAAILVVLWWKRGRISASKDVLPLVPFFGISAAAAVVTPWMERTFVGASGPAFQLGLAGRFLVAGRALWFYLGKVLWPTNLVFEYPRWNVDSHAAWQYLFPLSAIAVLGALFALRGLSRGPLAAALLFAGTLFPALGFIDVYPFVFSYVADHFQYLAAAGMISAAAAGLALVTVRLPAAGRTAAAGCVAALLGVLTWRQSGNFRDAQAFYGSILEGNPDSWLAHANLGVVLAGRGELDAAAEHFRESIRLNPSYPEAYNDYGNLLAVAHRWTDAEAAYAGALRARPSFAVAEFNWGKALSDEGSYDRAEVHFRNALRMQPDYADAHYGLANALANSGHLPDAIGEYREALKIRPESPEAHANMGLALAGEADWLDALSEISEALRLRPEYAEAHAYYGFALAGAGRFDEAVAQYRETIRRGLNNPDIHYQMALALARLGRRNEAEAEFAESRRLEAALRGHDR